jgi:hypothetical protein
MSSTNAESIIEIGRGHRMNLAVSGGFTHIEQVSFGWNVILNSHQPLHNE